VDSTKPTCYTPSPPLIWELDFTYNGRWNSLKNRSFDLWAREWNPVAVINPLQQMVPSLCWIRTTLSVLLLLLESHWLGSLVVSREYQHWELEWSRPISSWLARSNQASWTSGAGLIYKKPSLPPLNFWCSSSLDFMRDPVQEAVTTLLASLSKHRWHIHLFFFHLNGEIWMADSLLQEGMILVSLHLQVVC